MTTFRANGKLLISGEYFILDGAKGLALPTKFGQTLNVENFDQPGILWKSIDHQNKVWFEAAFDQHLLILKSTDEDVATQLQKILAHCKLPTVNCQLTTRLDFAPDWGLGSSSTLISLLAQFCKIDPYELLANTFNGSGYDIACATANGPITYQLSQERIIKNVDFNPAFKDSLYFIYLGKKQNSREGIQHYKNLSIDKSSYIEQISEVTEKLLEAKELDEFSYYLDVHENIVANALHLPKVKSLYFNDFPGSVKSLGAWGGDFVLVASDESPEMITDYFHAKGLSTIVPYSTMIL